MSFADENPLLFSSSELQEDLNGFWRTIRYEINELPKDQFLNASDDALVAHFESKWTRTPLEIYEDRIQADTDDCEVDVSHDWERSAGRDGSGPLMVPGLRLTLHIPFSGPMSLWESRPTPSRMTYPRGRVRPIQSSMSGELLIQIKLPSDTDSTRFGKLKDENLEGIRFFLERQKAQLEAFNKELPTFLRREIEARRARLRGHDDILSALNIPLRPKEGAPSFMPVQVERVVVPLPPQPGGGYQAEPGIRSEIYDHILKVIRHEGRAWESSPRTYNVHDEEELRDIVLSHLKTHFVSNATGETFRKTGKTDIQVSEGDRAAFIAECKIWRGQAQLKAALDQLLGYLTWRDCKAALVIFNKGAARFTEILEKIPLAMMEHRNFVRAIEVDEEGEWRFVFRSSEDESREITLHVFAFNLYVKE